MTIQGAPVTTLPKTRSTLLTIEETTRAAAGIKLLAASKGYSSYTTLHRALAANGYPGSYATFTRLLAAVRVAQRTEVESIARFFNVNIGDLTGAIVNPIKDPVPPRLIEYDVPRPAVPEGPAKLTPMPAVRRPARAPQLPAGEVLALAEAIDGLTAAVREMVAQQAPPVVLAQAG
jgi:hypothetical protein